MAMSVKPQLQLLDAVVRNCKKSVEKVVLRLEVLGREEHSLCPDYPLKCFHDVIL